MRKNLLLYVVLVCVATAGIFFLLKTGSRLEAAHAASAAPAGAPASVSASVASVTSAAPAAVPATGLTAVLREKLHDPLALLLLQIVVIVLATRLVGSLFVRMGQPSVIGEMLAGILLGPSLLGWLSPGTLGFLFPASSLSPLKMLSQIGVILFMFLVGMDLDLEHLREKAHSAIVVSHASILLPLLLGVGLSLFLYSSFAPGGVAFSSFALFIGVAMSITAFPVLARILEERGLSGTVLGSASIACAAVDDVTAWCLLAVVVAFARASGMASAALTVVLAFAFLAAMILLVKPRIERIALRRGESAMLQKGAVAALLVFAFACAFFTETIGIHALFGAFVAGIVAPPQREFRQTLRRRLEIVVSCFLLPLFFAFTGLRTQIGLLSDRTTWLACGAIIAVAILGKLGGGMLTARWTGMSWEDAFSIGTLMNTRGLMELIVLNIGYDLGILSQKVFAIMVLMALTTTFMTGPLLDMVEARKRRELPVASPSPAT
jgi:Kef-type K+ transport system membrane component KefB